MEKFKVLFGGCFVIRFSKYQLAIKIHEIMNKLITIHIFEVMEIFQMKCVRS